MKRKILGVLSSLFIAANVFGYTISGYVRNVSSGAIDGVYVVLSGTISASMYTTTTGSYTFTVSTGLSTITPSKAGYTFAPVSYSSNNVSASITQNFFGTPIGGAQYYKVVVDTVAGQANMYLRGNSYIGTSTGTSDAGVAMYSTGTIVTYTLEVSSIYGHSPINMMSPTMFRSSVDLFGVLNATSANFSGNTTFEDTTTFKADVVAVSTFGASTFKLINNSGNSGNLQMTSAGALKLDNLTNGGQTVFVVTNSSFCFAGGNVGIGISSPVASLDTSGSVRIGSGKLIDGRNEKNYDLTLFDTIATDTTTLRTQILTVGVSTGEIRADLNAIALSTKTFTTVATDTTSLRTDLNAVALSTAGVAKLNANQTFTAPNTFTSSVTASGQGSFGSLLVSGAINGTSANFSGSLTVESTGTIKGNAFSVGTSTFNVRNGLVTIGAPSSKNTDYPLMVVGNAYAGVTKAFQVRSSTATAWGGLTIQANTEETGRTDIYSEYGLETEPQLTLGTYGNRTDQMIFNTNGDISVKRNFYATGSLSASSVTARDGLLVRTVTSANYSKIYGQVGGNNILNLYGNNILAFGFDNMDANYHLFKIFDSGGIGGTTISGSTSSLSNINSHLTIVSTLSVAGNAFSVGGSTFVINMGRVGVGGAPILTEDKLHVLGGGLIYSVTDPFLRMQRAATTVGDISGIKFKGTTDITENTFHSGIFNQRVNLPNTNSGRLIFATKTGAENVSISTSDAKVIIEPEGWVNVLTNLNVTNSVTASSISVTGGNLVGGTAGISNLNLNSPEGVYVNLDLDNSDEGRQFAVSHNGGQQLFIVNESSWIVVNGRLNVRDSLTASSGTFTGDVYIGGAISGTSANFSSITGSSVTSLGDAYIGGSNLFVDSRNILDEIDNLTTLAFSTGVPYTGAVSDLNLGARSLIATNGTFLSSMTIYDNLNTGKDTNMGSVSVSSLTCLTAGVVVPVDFGIGTSTTSGRLFLLGGSNTNNGAYISLTGSSRGAGDGNILIKSGSALDNNNSSILFQYSGLSGSQNLGRFDHLGNLHVWNSVSASSFTATGTIALKSVPAIVSAGALHVASDGTVGTDASSIRYKKDIKPLIVKSKDILNLKPVSFTMKSDNTKADGLIAEEVEKVVPNLVIYKNGQVDGVKYEKLSVYLLKVVQEQQKQIDDLKAKVEVLGK